MKLIESALNTVNIVVDRLFSPLKIKNLQVYIDEVKKKDPKGFEKKVRLALLIATIGVSILILFPAAPLVAAATSLSPHLSTLILAPAAFVISWLIVKKVENKTHYWTAKVAESILEIEKKEAEKKAAALKRSIRV